MNKHLILLTLAASLGALCASAQGATDAFTLSQTQLRGTARYISMGGAFGALGGDLSTLTQNPAGIGVYRSSEIGATLDLDFQRSTMQNTGDFSNQTQKQTRFACNNFGYVGAIKLSNSLMPYFQWGATYNRLNSFDRIYSGYFPTANTSLTNYAASISQGYGADMLWGDDYYDPFWDGNVDWLSALTYNSYLISENPEYNPTAEDGASNSRQYLGLYQSGLSTADAAINVREKGYVDEYSLNFGGNFLNMVYWGVGLGITDLSFSRWSYYDEVVENALVPKYTDSQTQQAIGHTNGTAEWGLENYQAVSGTGLNLKLGVIVKPINELRLGLAVHTPTWYSMEFSQEAYTDYDLYWEDGDQSIHTSNWNTRYGTDNAYAETLTDYFSRKFKTPWRLMASAAGVIGGRFIVSADYVYESYPSMQFSDAFGVFTDSKCDIEQYYQAGHELRLGAEFRITTKFSVRAGYNGKFTAAKPNARDGYEYIYTSGTQPLYEFTGDRHSFTAGLGYRFGAFYLDAAYVHSTQTNRWSAFTPFPADLISSYALAGNAVSGPTADIRDTRNRLVLTFGVKF